MSKGVMFKRKYSTNTVAKKNQQENKRKEPERNFIVEEEKYIIEGMISAKINLRIFMHKITKI